ncbi:type 1 glutamine amidotransferase domain-containing protein [Roseovarius aestuariivivens]|uniref:type 1 glutamine amidotransferase domain-containing protein n=1 Tax=Roseovarius aestuariivivens TaxID=1888910 RepID=UPI0010810D0A|nr:type 1 glutamine amidotransferase domain-containing protein [Roseovarius aestuariivivens]
MTTPKILIIATSADKMDNGEDTGVWLEELTTPYYAFLDAGAEVTLASIAGGKIPVDARSLSEDSHKEDSVKRYMDDDVAQADVAETPRFDEIDTSGFDALFLPGGHGTMFDYPENPRLSALIEAFDRAGKIIAAVCHGPAALVGPKAASGAPLVKGRKVAAFTDSEERAVGLDEAVPFLLETKLRELGADHQKADDFQPFAVRDGNLVTGQNPQSAGKTAMLVLDAVNDMQNAA